MDIAGAKVLKKRLDPDAGVERQPAGADVDVPAGALPVFQWLGIAPPDGRAPSIEDEAPSVAFGGST